VLIAKTSERLSNLDYQKAFGVSKLTASRDLEDMLRKGILEKIGTTGKGTYYVLNRKGLMKRSGCKGLTKGSKGSSPGPPS
jgi:ATP-dependent DNA helicase RecG